MTTKLRIVYASILMVIMLAAIGTASAATVNVVPSSQNAAPGETFSVNVNIDSGSDTLHAAHVELNYDTNVLTAKTVILENLLGTDTLTEPGSGIGTGNVKYGVARTSSNPVAPVNGTFFTVQFEVKNNAPPGVSILDLVNVSLKKDAVNNIANPAVTGNIGLHANISIGGEKR